jgi:DNA-binding response OmpR family regulator
MSEIAPKDSGWASRSAGHSRARSAATSDSPAPAPTEAASSCPSPCNGATSVLIVEDDRTARTVFATILKRRGFAVREAATVAEAEAALDDRPQWVLLDLMLPDGCGTDVLRRARARGVRSRFCVITGCGAEMIDDARRAGAEHAFTKPLDVERLLGVLRA